MSVQRGNSASATYAVPGFNPSAPYPVIDPLSNILNGVRFDPVMIRENIDADFWTNVDSVAFQCWYAPWSCQGGGDLDLPSEKPPNRNAEVQESSDTKKALLIGAFLIVGVLVIRNIL